MSQGYIRWMDNIEWVASRVSDLTDDLQNGRPFAWEQAGVVTPEIGRDGHAVNPPRVQLRNGVRFVPMLRRPLFGYHRRVVTEVRDQLQDRLAELQRQ